MNFLDEAVYNVEKGATPPDPNSLDDKDVVNIQKEKLDPVGKEDDDINNDGKVDKTDSYLAKRRAAIKKALKKEMAKPETTDQKIQAFLDKVRDEMDARYGRNPNAKNTLTKPPTSNIKEKKTVELPADTTFTLDLKHLMKKHMDEGKSKEEVIKLTKGLMKQLHDKGEVKVDGTKVLFKEIGSSSDYDTLYSYLRNNTRVDADSISNMLDNMTDDQIKAALQKFKTKNEADTPQDTEMDFLGPDGKDYEGGMAKSQMLKMKNYAKALCDMIDDETQLEAWVQAKLTKASDYMSAVYHYLDYQKSKMDREEEHMTVGSKPEMDMINREEDPVDENRDMLSQDMYDVFMDELTKDFTPKIAAGILDDLTRTQFDNASAIYNSGNRDKAIEYIRSFLTPAATIKV